MAGRPLLSPALRGGLQLAAAGRPQPGAVRRAAAARHPPQRALRSDADADVRALAERAPGRGGVRQAGAHHRLLQQPDGRPAARHGRPARSVPRRGAEPRATACSTSTARRRWPTSTASRATTPASSRSDGDVAVLRSIDEAEITNVLLSLSRQRARTVCFVIGHGERDPENTDERAGYSDVGKALERERFARADAQHDAARRRAGGVHGRRAGRPVARLPARRGRRAAALPARRRPGADAGRSRRAAVGAALPRRSSASRRAAI